MSRQPTASIAGPPPPYSTIASAAVRVGHGGGEGKPVARANVGLRPGRGKNLGSGADVAAVTLTPSGFVFTNGETCTISA
jgi:hypothetical protein